MNNDEMKDFDKIFQQMIEKMFKVKIEEVEEAFENLKNKEHEKIRQFMHVIEDDFSCSDLIQILENMHLIKIFKENHNLSDKELAKGLFSLINYKTNKTYDGMFEDQK